MGSLYTKKPRTQAFLLAAMALILFSLVSCGTIRKATYPENFVYIDNKVVHTTMQKMAISVDRLDQLLFPENGETEMKKEKVIAELDSLRELTQTLGGNAVVSNHRVISDNIGSFRLYIREARSAVDRAQPNYYPAGKLVGQCLACHVKNVTESDAI